MKRLLLVSLFLLAWIPAYGDPPSSWARGFPSRAAVNSLEQTADGGSVVAGTFSADDGARAVIFRLSSSGNLKWARAYGVKEKEAHAYVVQQASDGGFIVAGGFGVHRRDALVVRLDASGNILWQKAYGSRLSTEEAAAIIQTADGGFFLLGSSYFNLRKVVWCMKLSGDGSVLWQKAYGSPRSNESMSSAIATTEGGVIIVGSRGDLPWVVKLNSGGGIIWQKTYTLRNRNSSSATSIAVTTDGAYVVGSSEGWALKIDLNGVPQWQTAFYYTDPSRSMQTRVAAVRQEKDGHIWVMGTIAERRCYGWHCGDVTRDIWGARLNPDGKLFWQEEFGNERPFGGVSAIHEASNDGTLFAGYSKAPFVARTSHSGLVCSSFQRSLKISVTEVKATATPAQATVLACSFETRMVHLEQYSASVKVINLCASK